MLGVGPPLPPPPRVEEMPPSQPLAAPQLEAVSLAPCADPEESLLSNGQAAKEGRQSAAAGGSKTKRSAALQVVNVEDDEFAGEDEAAREMGTASGSQDIHAQPRRLARQKSSAEECGATPKPAMAPKPPPPRQPGRVMAKSSSTPAIHHPKRSASSESSC
jgi:hypothetical protein